MIVKATGLLLQEDGSTAIWNAIDKDASLTLSNGDRTLTRGAVASPSWKSGRASPPRASGKWYVEFTLSFPSGYGAVGLSRPAATLSNFVGFDGDAIGYASTGFFYRGGTPIATVAGYSTGTVIGIAVDYDAAKIWFSKAGTWVVGDPIAGTDPLDANMGGGGLLTLPSMSAYGDGDSVTIKGAGQLTYSAPNGFLPWR